MTAELDLDLRIPWATARLCVISNGFRSLPCANARLKFKRAGAGTWMYLSALVAFFIPMLEPGREPKL